MRPGAPAIADVAGVPVAVHRTADGRLVAFRNACPHRGGPVGEGVVLGDVVICPWHGWRFRLADGANVANPLARLVAIEAREEDGRVLVRVP